MVPVLIWLTFSDTPVTYNMSPTNLTALKAAAQAAWNGGPAYYPVPDPQNGVHVTLNLNEVVGIGTN